MGEGKYSTPAYFSHPLPPKGREKKILNTCELSIQWNSLSKRLIISLQNTSFSPTPHHHSIKGLFTAVPFMCYIILFYFFINLFILFILVLAVLGLHCCMGFLQLQRVGATLHCSAWASHCGGFSYCRAQTLGMRASVAVAHGLSSCGMRALERRLSSCGSWTQLFCGMWDLPGPGLESMSSALAGGFLTTVPPGKPYVLHYNQLSRKKLQDIPQDKKYNLKSQSLRT